MSSSKRSLPSDSESENDEEYPNKTAKLNKDDPALSQKTGLDRIDLLETRLLKSYKKAKDLIAKSHVDDARIQNLESQNFDLLEFVSKNQQNLPNNLPHSILIQLESFPAAQYAAETRKSIDQKYAEIQQRCKGYGGWMALTRATEAASEEMPKYVSEIEHLSRMPGGLDLALELILHLSKKTYFVAGSGHISDDGKRKVDGRMDDLLVEMLKKMKAASEHFNPIQIFLEVDRTRRLFSTYESASSDDIGPRPLFVHDDAIGPFSNNDTFFTKSYELMWSYLEGQNAVELYRKKVEAGISRTYEEIESEARRWNRKDAFEFSSYKLSLRLKEYVQAVRRLRYMDGCTLHAFQLALLLGKCSYTSLPSMFGGYNYRPSDPLIDGLLVEMFYMVKKEDSKFDPTQVVLNMEGEIAYLEQRGIHSYFPRSYKHLRSGLPGAKAAEKTAKAISKIMDPDTKAANDYYRKSRQEISSFSRGMVRSLEKLLRTNNRTSEDWVSERILLFFHHAQELSESPGGLISAIDLVFLLGKYSYTTLPGIGPTIGNGRVPYVVGMRGESPRFARPSDTQLDDFLLKLLHRAKETGELTKLDLKEETSHLKAQIEYLAEFDITSYFKQSYPLMLSWAQ